MITSKTSTTSTIGVTLMPTMAPLRPPRPALSAAAMRASSVATGRRELAHAAVAGVGWRRLPGRARSRARVVCRPRLEQRRDLLGERSDVVFDAGDRLLDHVV